MRPAISEPLDAEYARAVHDHWRRLPVAMDLLSFHVSRAVGTLVEGLSYHQRLTIPLLNNNDNNGSIQPVPE